MKHEEGHKKHPHHKMSAMKQFNEGHWVKDASDVEVAGGQYTSEFGQAQEYKKDVDMLAGYVKKHRAEH